NNDNNDRVATWQKIVEIYQAIKKFNILALKNMNGSKKLTLNYGTLATNMTRLFFNSPGNTIDLDVIYRVFSDVEILKIYNHDCDDKVLPEIVNYLTMKKDNNDFKLKSISFHNSTGGTETICLKQKIDILKEHGWEYTVYLQESNKNDFGLDLFTTTIIKSNLNSDEITALQSELGVDQYTKMINDSDKETSQ
ncbi:MAG: hypothetical protein GY730_03715, partial [bacterium]|nr:hypothetical protein [bacterium]